MQEVTFHILPLQDPEANEQSLTNFAELKSIIQQNGDQLVLSYAFYECKAYENAIQNNNSTTKLFFELFLKLRADQTACSAELMQTDFHHRQICVDSTLPDSLSNTAPYTIRNKCELIENYQKSAVYLEDFGELFDWTHKCFPILLFTSDSFGSNQKPFGRDSGNSELIQQTIHCLSILNNHYNELQKNSESERIAYLGPLLSPGITCSGKGNNESIKCNKEIRYHDEIFTVSCSPHFKLIRRDSNYRIYFSWGTPKIKDHEFIVVKIGGHWQDNTDSMLSAIKTNS
ncbi:MAG: hypothetical protein K5705_03040 [Oscillospiraceae bacterium]|nr:hypothetical protein [Oscillospiraceae bacterium]